MRPFAIDHVTLFDGGESTVCAEADHDSGKVENFVRSPASSSSAPRQRCSTRTVRRLMSAMTSTESRAV